jgi:twitching motility protein PilJ
VAKLQDTLTSEKPVASLLAVIAFAGLFFLVLVLMVLVFLADTRRRAAEAETENRRNQEAILRLLNEMGDLADGDLTIKAQVTEDITGAIADSMNYTIDELRNLVTGVNNAAIQVTQKTAQAQSISNELLSAAERQSKEIEETTSQVLQVSKSISEGVDHRRRGRASRATLAGGRRQGPPRGAELDLGHERHPRADPGDVEADQAPGESSQEIGEIVELISDITSRRTCSR